jgi:hypothetical protein
VNAAGEVVGAQYGDSLLYTTTFYEKSPFDRPVGDGGFFGWDAATAPAGTITYDANGNLTKLDADPYHLTGLVYDERNLPTQLEAGEGHMAHYRYSAAGQRTYKQVGSQPAEHYLLDGAATVGVVAGGSVRFANLLTPDGRVIGRYTANLDRRYYYTDHLGSTRAVVDGSGTVVETRDDYPYIPLRSISRLRLVWPPHARSHARRGVYGEGGLHRARLC